MQKSPNGQYLLYVSYVDPTDNRWRIDVIPSAHPAGFDPARAQAVLTADGTGTEGVKDPYVWKVGPAYYLFASFVQARSWNQEERTHAHAAADVYTTGLSIAPTGLALSFDGRTFRWLGEVLPVGEGWDKYQARLTGIVPLGSAFLGLYDGSANAGENYEEHAGLALSFDLKHWDKVTFANPWVVGAHGSGSVRYMHPLWVKNELWLYYEYCRCDMSHELRLTRLKL